MLYNSFNNEFYLIYKLKNDIKVYFYINNKINLKR